MQKAPLFFLTAVGASRMVGGPPGPAVPLLLIFHSHHGASLAHRINATARELYPTVEELQIASIVDLSAVPRFMRGLVEQTLAAAYHKAATQVPANRDPREYVLIAPDWDGKVTRVFQMQTRAHDVGLVLISSAWELCHRYTENEPQSVFLDLLAGHIRAQQVE